MLKTKLPQFIFLILVLFTIGCKEKNNQKTAWQEDNLKGKVKSVVERQYMTETKFGDIQKTHEWSHRKTEYSVEGKKMIWTDYTDNQISHKNVFWYDEVAHKSGYSRYDESGKIEMKFKINGYRQPNEIRESYDSEGNLQGRWIISYDTKGSEIQKRFYDGWPELRLQNVETKKHQYYSNSNYIIRTDVTYTRYDVAPAKTTKSVQLFKYDLRGNQTEIDFLNSKSKMLFEYDDNDNVIKTTTDGNSITLKSYVYDKRNNWVKRIDHYEHRPMIIEREIEYYD